MMRRPQNYGYEPVPQNQTDEVEIENERLAEELKNKISSLKSLTIDIGKLCEHLNLTLISKNFYLILGNEVRYQDKLIDDLGDDTGRISGFMSSTIGRVMRLNKNKRGYTCYMLLFSLIVFLILYIFLKFR